MFQKYDQGSSEAHTQPRRSCHTPGKDNVPDNLAVDGARDAVLQLQVHLGYGVLREDGGIRDVTYCNCKRLLIADRRKEKRTNSSRLNHVADGEPLDGLVLGGASRAVAASDGLDVAAALLVSAAERLLAIVFSVRERQSCQSSASRACSRISSRGIVGGGGDCVTGRRRRDSYLFFLFLTILTVAAGG